MAESATQIEAVDQAVEQKLDHAATSEGMPQEGHTGADMEHAAPAALGMDATGWVSLSMLALLAIVIFMKVPKAVAKSIDDKIGGIRAQLAEAETLRKEAEQLRDSYAAKLKSADGEAADIRKAAEDEAAALVAKTKTDTEALIVRRRQMAEDKIAAAERSAIAELRAKTASAAALAAQGLMAEKHDASSDAKLVDAAIKSLN